MELQLENSAADRDLEQSRLILHRVFRLPRFQTLSYLDWLYRQNPDGPALIQNHDQEGVRLGHVAVVPNYLVGNGSCYRIAMALHSVVAPECRGQGVFSSLIRAIQQSVIENNIPLLSGVGNRPALAAWTKMGLVDTGTLPVHILYTPIWRHTGGYTIDSAVSESARFEKILGSIDFHPRSPWEPHWNAQRLRWRLANPIAKYWLHDDASGLMITTVTRYRGLKIGVLLKTFRKKGNVFQGHGALSEAGRFHKTPFFIYAGKRQGLDVARVPLPDFLRPSPLCTVMGNYDNVPITSLSQLDGFEFLDFDAY